MNDLATHPGRSEDFLSRLHDGDVTIEERKAFEAHCGRCPECRDAAATFEAALALFRSTAAEAPAPGLSARVIRGIRASGTSPGSGAFFGFDLRWAGALATALLAILIGSMVAVRHTSPPAMVPAVAPAVAPERRDTFPAMPPAPAPAPERKAGAMTKTRERRPQPAVAAAPSDASERPTADAFAPPPPEAVQAVEERAASRPEEASPPQAAAALPAPPRALEKAKAEAAPRRASRPGGFAPSAEGQVSQAAPTGAAAQGLSRQPRLELYPLDGGGAVPELASGPMAAQLPDEVSGREFVLDVGADGSVRAVRPARPQGESRAESRALELLRNLRFQPGDAPRVLGVRVRGRP